jgi:uncharacterized membrane protein
MTAVHLHLILNHFPIIGTIIGMFLLAYGLLKNSVVIQNIALVIFIAMAIITIPVYISGDIAEEIVEVFDGVSSKTIEKHHEIAEKGVVLMGILGFASLFVFYNNRKQLIQTNLLLKLIFLLSIITSILFAVIGNYGGQIRHPEIRKNTEIITYQKPNS